MFKFDHAKQSNGYQCALYLSNYFGNSDAPLIISKRFFNEIEEIKPWAISNVETFLTGTFEAYFIRINAITTIIHSGKGGGDSNDRMKFIEAFWKLKKMSEHLESEITVWKMAIYINENLQTIIDTIPKDKNLNFELFKAMATDIIKATKFIIKTLQYISMKTFKRSLTPFQRIRI